MSEEPKKNPGGTLKKRVGFLGLFIALAVVAFGIIVVVEITSTIQHPFGPVLFFGFLYAIVFALAATLFIAFCRWLFCWRNLKQFLFGVACLLTLIALFYAEEDVRGKHEWESYKSSMEAKGEKMEFGDYLPAEVPDEQNFAMTPVAIALVRSITSETVSKTWYGDRADSDDVAKLVALLPCNSTALTGTNYWKYTQPPLPDLPVLWPTGGVANLKAWQAYYHTVAQRIPGQVSVTPQPQSPAADVLLALGKYEPVIEQLRQSSQLPGSRFPVQYDVDDPWGILLPHLGAMRGCATVLQLRALAELQSNQPSPAFDDVQLMFRLNDSISNEPFIITHLVRMVMMQMSLQVIYEGLARHQWSDAQLVQMDSELAKMDYLADFHRSVSSETAAHTKLMLWLAQKRSRILEIISADQSGRKPPKGAGMVVAEFYTMPKGWFYQGDLLLAQANQIWQTGNAVDDARQIVSPTLSLQSSNAVAQIMDRRTPFNVVGRMLIPEWSRFALRTAYGQTSANLGRTAIALERYHLAHGEFPVSLDALEPEFIQAVPHDIINGQPLQYHRTGGGQFILYSIGWNGVDDGGQMAMATYRYGSDANDSAPGDWVWAYPEK